MADRISQELSEKLIDGFLQYDYTEVWQVAASGIAASLSDASIPPIGQQYNLSGISSPVWCYTRIPRRRDNKQAKNLFDITCTFSNATTRFERDLNGNPAQQPEDIVPKVDVQFEDEQIESVDANLIGFTDATSTDPLSVAIYTAPPYLSSRVLQSPGPNDFIGGPMVNSANDAYPNRYTTKSRRVITYWTWHRNWDENWETYIGKVNNDQVVASQYDGDGLRLRYVFPRLTVRIKDIIKEDHWRSGKLYFRRGIVLNEKKESWLTKITDEGFNRMVWEGQYKGTSTLYTSAQLDEKFKGSVADGYRTYYQKWPILTFDDQDTAIAPGDPVPLNSYGLRLGERRPESSSADDTIKAAWYLEHRLENFAGLGIF